MSAAKPEVLLIDLSGIFWRAWMSNGETLNARDYTLSLIRRCMESCGFQAPVALCLDMGKSFRKDIFPEYKANRPDKDLQAYDEMSKTVDALGSEGFTMWAAGSFEADDVIASAAKIALNAGHSVRVASADKDLLQLLALDGVTVLRTHDMSVWGRQEVIAKFGVPPELLGDWLALVGDDSDNIRGIPGVGPKTAAGFLTAFPGLEALIEAAATGKADDAPNVRGAKKLARAIAQGAKDVRLARQLVELRFDAAVIFDEIYRPRERRRPEPHQEELSMDAANEITQGAGAPEKAQEAPAPAAAPEPTPAPAIAPQAAAPAAPGPVVKAADTKAMTQVLVPELIGPYERALEPLNATQALNMAKVLWDSGLYSRFPNKEALYTVITRGREIGIPAAAALDVFHYMPEVSRVAPLAHLVAALVERDPSCEYLMCVETDATTATYEFKHRRHPKARSHTYTIQEAVQAGLCQLEARQRDWTPDPKSGKPGKDHRGPWDSRRPEMLRKTCVIQIGRIYFPAAALGLYAMEEWDSGEAS